MTEDWRSEVPWRRLRELALEATPWVYAPYSDYLVGVAVLVDDGRLVLGYNVENTGYGVTLCAECRLVSELVRGGGGKLLVFVCVNADTGTTVPYGRHRQLLAEHASPVMALDMPGNFIPMAEALPFTFGPGDLNTVEWTTLSVSKEN